MELVTSTQELNKAITDLPICIMCLIFALVITSKKGDSTYKYLFYSLSLSSFLGIIAHAFAMSEIPLRILWIVLYGLMILVVDLFYIAILDDCMGKYDKAGKMKFIYILSIIFFILCAGIRLVTGINMIAAYALFGLIVSIKAGIIIFTKGRKEFKAALMVLLFGLLCQAAGIIWPSFNGAAAAHIFIIAALVILFLVPLKEIRENRN